MDKERLINSVVVKMGDALSSDQLKMLKTVLLIGLKDYKVEIWKNEIVLYDPTSDAAAYKQYFVSKKIQGLSKNTLYQYQLAIDRFMRSVRKPYSEVTSNDIRLYLANRSMIDNLSNASLNRERGAICRFFKWLRDEEFLEKDPGSRVEMIKIEKRLKKPFSEVELERLRNACVNSKESAIIELLMSTGCRVSEVVSLSFESMNREKQSVSVVGKGNKERSVYLNPRSQVALLAYCYENGHTEGPLLQGRRRGSPMTKSGIEKAVKRIGLRAGVENVHPHRFRRTAATLALKRGMEIEKIMKFMGHESVDTTLLYAIVSDDDLEFAHKKYIT